MEDIMGNKEYFIHTVKYIRRLDSVFVWREWNDVLDNENDNAFVFFKANSVDEIINNLEKSINSIPSFRRKGFIDGLLNSYDFEKLIKRLENTDSEVVSEISKLKNGIILIDGFDKSEDSFCNIMNIGMFRTAYYAERYEQGHFDFLEVEFERVKNQIIKNIELKENGLNGIKIIIELIYRIKDLIEANQNINPKDESVLNVEQEVACWIGKFRASDNSYPILKFEDYKLNFDAEIKKKLEPLQHLESELKNVNEYLENYRHNTKIPKNTDYEFQDYNDKPNKTTTIIDLIYQMTNDNFSINYSVLSQYLQKKLIKPLVLAQIVTPIQYKRYLEVKKTDLNATPATPENPKIEAVEKKKVKTFIEYLSHTQSEKFAESLKNEFNFEKGKSIKLLIKTLENKLILILGEREMKNFYEAMKKYFDRNIGTYQSINDFKYSENSHKKDLYSINIRLEKVIKEHEKQENSL